MMVFLLFFFFKQKTAYEIRISDWSSDVCSSDLFEGFDGAHDLARGLGADRNRHAGMGAQKRLGEAAGFRRRRRDDAKAELPVQRPVERCHATGRASWRERVGQSA